MYTATNPTSYEGKAYRGVHKNKIAFYLYFKVRLHTAIKRADFVSWCMLYT